MITFYYYRLLLQIDLRDSVFISPTRVSHSVAMLPLTPDFAAAGTMQTRASAKSE